MLINFTNGQNAAPNAEHILGFYMDEPAIIALAQTIHSRAPRHLVDILVDIFVHVAGRGAFYATAFRNLPEPIRATHLIDVHTTDAADMPMLKAMANTHRYIAPIKAWRDVHVGFTELRVAGGGPDEVYNCHFSVGITAGGNPQATTDLL